MSAAEIIEEIKTLSPEDRNKVLTFITGSVPVSSSLYDDFTVLGNDPEGSDVSHAVSAQAEVLKHEPS